MIPLSRTEIEQLVSWDRRHSWKPFTQMQEYVADTPLIISEADGETLIDVNGRRFFDGVSSLWCNLLGHRHPDIDRTVTAQLRQVAHSTLLGPTNVPATRLAHRLAGVAPAGLSRVFFSDNGSTGVEVALKMAYQFWQHRGQTRRQSFIALEGGYHGDTLGAVGVGGIELFHAAFRPLLLKCHFVPAPFAYRAAVGSESFPDAPQTLFYPDVVPPEAEECLARSLAALEGLLAEKADTICALIVEPIVQGAAGMRHLVPGYLAAARALCTRYDVLLIADEVMTGFGRTGRLLACSHEGVTPDLLVLSKGLTGGYMPLAATLASERIYEAFLGEYTEFKTFFHGHTYTGHPLGCAAALAVLDVLERDRIIERSPSANAALRRGLAEIARHPNVGRIGLVGTVGAVQLVADRRTRSGFEPGRRVGRQVCRAALDEGLLVRPLSDTIVIMPPLTTEPPVLEWLCDVIRRAIVRVLGD